MAAPAHQFIYKHIVIVHGIGDQVPNETALNFMNHFLRALPEGEGYKLDVDLLIQSVHPPDKERANAQFDPSYVVFHKGSSAFVIGFSEVYWQDITDGFLTGREKIPPI